MNDESLLTGTQSFPVRRYQDGRLNAARPDELAVEDPLEIRLRDDTGERTLSITMRTPGQDEELALGFLITEAIIDPTVLTVEQLQFVRNLRRDARHSSLTLVFPGGVKVDWSRLERHAYVSSSCGVCGKTAIEQLYPRLPYPESPDQWRVSPVTLAALPDRLRESQPLFASTGGIHAAGLFSQEGELLCCREDVGRHNAMDKLVGWAYWTGRLPLHRHLLQLSGRASFELLQKAAMAGIRVVSAVGAPSSLAVRAAEDLGITLVGFNKGNRFNVYTGAGRLETS